MLWACCLCLSRLRLSLLPFGLFKKIQVLESDFFIDYRHQEWHGRSNKTQMRARPITEQKFLNFFSRCFYCVYFNRLRLSVWPEFPMVQLSWTQLKPQVLTTNKNGILVGCEYLSSTGSGVLSWNWNLKISQAYCIIIYQQCCPAAKTKTCNKKMSTKLNFV
jgi:hypothetical protein